MHSLILLAAIAQATASDGPPRQWLPGVINGKTVQVWGWPENGGRSVGYRPGENPHLTGAARPTSPSTISPGITLGADGEMNAGVDLQSTRPTTGFTTNDPELGRKIGLAADDEEESCRIPDLRNLNPLAKYEPYVLPGTIVAIAILVLASKRPER